MAGGGYYEFFAGGGMARAGLGAGWRCLLANDLDAKKAAAYAANWGAEHLRVADVATLAAADLPGVPDLVWASFPCQDLSLAGAGAGLRGARSGTFWPFWKLVTDLRAQGRAPRLVVLENVVGALTSHGGRDFAAIGRALAEAGYRFGAVVANAVDFLPQSRPRLFFVAVEDDGPLPEGLAARRPLPRWHPPALVEARAGLKGWVWWRLPAPAPHGQSLAGVIEDTPSGVAWRAGAETERLLASMSPVNRAKVAAAQAAGGRHVGTVYKRTRAGVVRAEVRFDDVAGCLRTPAGGSSRQTLLLVEDGRVRSRLLSPREAARLMGLPDSYRLPANYNEAYHLAGDGVAVPVVRFLAAHLLEPLLAAAPDRARAAA
ncbi:DNA cytosine methyltransferase [Amaricoccus sp.]|uniref:DNA cytosine methyltransferase n=1 Tax=Amaricoccus sp. TaxID=1872485 RepID=UPI001B441FFB|nr:DNA (cytosine-5-)-methyltransferase [Amaricoccus sp.]MBP7000233.1 DNA cytosine methyltransferase [Amaricoccus sp.]